MLSENELRSATVKELIKIAGNVGVIGRWDMRKEALVNAIMILMRNEEKKQAKKAEEKKCDDQIRRESENFRCRLDELKLGDIVAFRRLVSYEDGMYSKMETGLVIEICTGTQDGVMIVIETKNGCKYSVKKEGILWIRYGLKKNLKWPSFIFKELKAAPVPYAPDSDCIVAIKVLE